MLVNNNYSISFGSKYKNPYAYFRSNTGESKIRMMIFSDMHGITPFSSFKTASKLMALKSKFDGASYYVVTPGDLIIDSPLNEKITYKYFLKPKKMKAPIITTLGNHDLDVGDWAKFVKTLKETKAIILSCNLKKHKHLDKIRADRLEIFADKTKKITTEGKEINGFGRQGKRIFKSVLFHQKDGKKVGFIGVSPSHKEFNSVSRKYEDQDIFRISTLDKTKLDIQKEVAYMKEQGVDIINLVSHLGRNLNEQIKKDIKDVNFIHLGHTHEVYDGVKLGKNLHYEGVKPVVATETGSEGFFFDELTIEFKNKIVKTVTNKILSRFKFMRDWTLQTKIHKILNTDPHPINELEIKNPTYLLKGMKPEEFRAFYFKLPMANLLTKAIRSQTNTQVALTNISTIRNPLTAGPITQLDVKTSMFGDELYVNNLSENELLNTFKKAAKKYYKDLFYPERMLYADGAGYTVQKNGELKDVWYTNKLGNKIFINLKNPSKTKDIKTVYSKHLNEGGLGYTSLKSELKLENRLEKNQIEIVLDYIKELKRKGLKILIEETSSLLFEEPLNKVLKNMPYLLRNAK